MIEWGRPENFIWLWVLPVLLLIFWVSSVRKSAAIGRFGDTGLVAKLVQSFSSTQRLIKRALLILAAASLIAALCQPHFRTKEIEVERRGVNVMIAVDVSRSMLAKDIAPNRLEKAKLELSTLIDRLRQDRIGVVAFAGEAFIQCPLTLDKNAVKIFLSTINPNIIPAPGTSIGAAIRVSAQAFDEKDADNKAIILLTDGEDHESDPEGAAKKAAQTGIRIFTIGFGTQDGSTVPGEGAAEGFKKDKQGRVILSKLDESLLKRIAQETGGGYYRSSRGELEIDGIVRGVRGLTQKGFSKDKIIEYDENFQYFLVIAMILLALEMILSERRSSSKNGLGASASMLLVCLVWPMLCGFEFYSALKNEEGNKFYKKGLVGRAEQSYTKAQKSEPKAPEIAFNLGNAYYKQDSYDRSLQSYASAAKSNVDPELTSKAFYNIGNALFRRKDNAKAIEAYKEALRQDSRNEDAKYNLELLLKKPDQNQQKDQQKQQDKQDEKDQKNPQGQKDQQEQKNQQGQKSPQDQKNQEGQEDQKKQKDQQDKQGSDKPSEQGSQGGQDQQKEQGEGPPKGQEEKKDDGKPQNSEGAGSEEQDKETKQEQPKSQSEIRAEQILNALDDQERQVFKVEAGQKGPVARARKYVEKDW